MTTFLTRRTALLAAATCAATLGLAAIAQAQTSIKIGYAHFAHRPEHRRRRRHHDPQLRIVGEGSECRRWHQARRQARPDRGRAVRRPLQRRRGRARAGAADQPGQGRFHPAAMGHRPQSGGRPDAQPRRLSAPRRDRRDRPRAGTRQALAQQFLDARHQRGCRQDAGRTADQTARRKEDRRHGRDGQHCRRFRHRPVERGAAGAHQRQIQARLRQELSDRHAGSRADHQRGQGAQSGCLHRLQLSAGYAGADRAIAHRRLQSENFLHRRRHRLPALSSRNSARTPKA